MTEKRINIFFQAILLFSLLPNKLFISPRYAIDSSWQIALNNAVTNHYRFGKEMVFTYGPLGFLSYGLPLGLGFWSVGIVLYKLVIVAGLFLIGRKSLLGQSTLFGKLMIVFAFFFCAKFYAFDPGMVMLTLITLGCIYTLYEPGTRGLFGLGVLAVVGFFVKMNSGFVGICFVGITMIFLLARKKISLKQFLSLTAALAGLLALLMLVFRVDMGAYIRHSLTLVNYYNDAMAVPLPPRSVTPISVLALGILFTAFFIAAFKRSTDKQRWAVAFFMAGAFCFILFKQGFVVAATNHQLIFFNAIPFLFLGLSGIKGFGIATETRDTLNYLAIFFTVCAVFSIGYMTFHSRVLRDLYMKEPVTIRDMPGGIKQRIGSSTVDIFPSDIDRLYFQQLNFITSPIPQGYSVYHASLDALNAAFYRSPKAPRFVVMGIGSTPGRHPFWDETQTKIAVRDNYQVVDSFRFTNEVELAAFEHFYLLEQKQAPAKTEVKRLGVVPAHVNEKIAIPGSEYPVLMKADVHYSLWNKLKRFFFQPTLLRCIIYYGDGTFSEHNAILPTLADGVIINKRLLSNEEGSWFFGVERNMIRATSIEFKGDDFWFDKDIEIRFSEIR